MNEREELIEAYEEYVHLLSQSEKSLLYLAHVRGYRVPVEQVRRGEELRARIFALKSSTGVPAQAVPDCGESGRAGISRLRHAILKYLNVFDACGGSESVSAEAFADARHGLREAVAEVPPSPSSWQPIETAPKDGTRILLFKASRGAFEGWWHTAWPHPEAYWMDDADSEPEPTHWRPTLPLPSTQSRTAIIDPIESVGARVAQKQAIADHASMIGGTNFCGHGMMASICPTCSRSSTDSRTP